MNNTCNALSYFVAQVWSSWNVSQKIVGLMIKFNPHLLKAWNANIDIHYLNPTPVSWILTYISKAEHKMSGYFKRIMKESWLGNTSDREEIKQRGQRSRDYCSDMQLKNSLHSVIFIPTDENAVKMSLPMKYLQNKEPDATDIWVSGLTEKYKVRLETTEFEIVYGRVCLHIQDCLCKANKC